MATALKTKTIFTEKNHHEATAPKLKPIDQLKRTVMCCMLWENGFYESGELVAKRISDIIPQCNPQDVLDLALEVKTKGKLRHTPLYLLIELIKTRKGGVDISGAVDKLITRSDELIEILAIYWKDGKNPLPAKLKKGLCNAFYKFNEYNFSRVPKDKDVKLRDVLRLVHPKPKTDEQALLWKKIITGELQTPDTWQVRLSGGADKKQAWTELLNEKKLGALDVLRNIRNMVQVSVDIGLILNAVDSLKTDRILPFQFISAYRYTKQILNDSDHKKLAVFLQNKMFECVKQFQALSGRTLILVDTSGSMDEKLSAKSDLKRIDAAAGIAIIAQNICEVAEIACFNTRGIKVDPEIHGFILSEAFNKILGGGTSLAPSLSMILTDAKARGVTFDRIIVFTDEQSDSDLRHFSELPSKNYLINIACNQNGIAYDTNKWVQISGFSESVIQFIAEYELN